MTTKMTKRLFADILHDPSWPMFDVAAIPQSAIELRQVDLLELICPLSHSCPTLEAAAQDAGDWAAKLLLPREGWRTWAFVAHGPWQPANRIVKYRGLWKDLLLLSETGVLWVSNEVLFEADAGIRFAGMVEVTGDAFLKAVELVRTDSACFLLSTQRSSVESSELIRDLFHLAFPSRNGVAQDRIDWLSLVLGICRFGDIAIRVSGNFGDNEASIDMIGSARELAALTGGFKGGCPL